MPQLGRLPAILQTTTLLLGAPPPSQAPATDSYAPEAACTPFKLVLSIPLGAPAPAMSPTLANAPPCNSTLAGDQPGSRSHIEIRPPSGSPECGPHPALATALDGDRQGSTGRQPGGGGNNALGVCPESKGESGRGRELAGGSQQERTQSPSPSATASVGALATTWTPGAGSVVPSGRHSYSLAPREAPLKVGGIRGLVGSAVDCFALVLRALWLAVVFCPLVLVGAPLACLAWLVPAWEARLMAAVYAVLVFSLRRGGAAFIKWAQVRGNQGVPKERRALDDALAFSWAPFLEELPLPKGQEKKVGREWCAAPLVWPRSPVVRFPALLPC